MAGLISRLAELTDEQLEEGTRTLSGIRTDVSMFYRSAMLMELDRRRGKGTKGDLPGHPFRGNQWTGGSAGPSQSSIDRAVDDSMDVALGVLSGKQPPNSATKVRKIDESSIRSDNALGKGGVNTTRIVEIEEPDGTVGKYVFKPDDGEHPGVHPAFRGHQSANEVAASVVDEAMGLDMVAKTEMAEIGGKKGSLQKWINSDAKVADSLIEWDENDMVKDSSKLDATEGVADMLYFDALIGNHDRHINNWLVKDGKVKLIDNGMSMADNMEYGDDLSFRTMEHSRSKRMLTRMSPKFKSSLERMLANKEQVDAKLKEAGVGAAQRASFWKRAAYIQRAGMIGFGDSTLRDLGRLAEGRQLF